MRVTWHSASDADLVSVLPDPDALEELFLRYRRTLVAYGARRCWRPEDVADLLTGTFLAMLESADRYDPHRGEVRAWLFGIARRQLGLLIRQDYRDRTLRTKLPSDWEHSPDDMARIEEQIDAARAAPEVERAMAGLPERHREALWLVSYDGLTNREAAAVVGVRPGAFRVRLTRARRALRAALDDPISTFPAPALSDPNALEVHS